MRRLRICLLFCVLAGLLIPFVLQQSFYPFFRFGMFAEPIKTSIQTENFLLSGVNLEGDTINELSAESGIHKSNMDYLLRNYYYRSESTLFLEKITTILPSEQFKAIFIVRIVEKDSSIVASLP